MYKSYKNSINLSSRLRPFFYSALAFLKEVVSRPNRPSWQIASSSPPEPVWCGNCHSFWPNQGSIMAKNSAPAASICCCRNVDPSTMWRNESQKKKRCGEIRCVVVSCVYVWNWKCRLSPHP